MDMKDKFSILVRDYNDNIIDAFNVIAGTFSEVEKMARQKEEETGKTYVITKDAYIFQVIQVLQEKYINTINKLIDIDDAIREIISGKEEE